MKRHIILLFLSFAVLLVACDKDDETILSDRCYISSLSLGMMKRAVHYQSSSGKDSIHISTYNASTYVMTVDQRTRTIENRDSLLSGSLLDAVLVSVEYVGGGLSYRPVSGGDADWKSYSEKDSIDVSEPVLFSVLAEDGVNYRFYTLSVNVHQQEGDSLTWSHMESADVFEGMAECSAVILGQRLMVIGRTAGGIQVAMRSSLGSEGEWELQPTDLPETTDVEGIKQNSEKLYASTSEGALYVSTDGLTWSEETPATSGFSLAAVTDSILYAIVDGKLCSSEDGQAWSEEALDDEPQYLPAYSLRSYILQQDNGNHRLLMMGYRENETDTAAVVWSKVWGQDEKEGEAIWMFINPTEDNTFLMPRLQHLTAFPYDNHGVAIGSASEPGRGSHQPLDAMYFSYDHGITWKADKEIQLPAEVRGVSGPLAVKTDADNYIWLILNNEVWRGRLNRLGFVRQ